MKLHRQLPQNNCGNYGLYESYKYIDLKYPQVKHLKVKVNTFEIQKLMVLLWQLNGYPIFYSKKP
jgi:hypothetical protein